MRFNKRKFYRFGFSVAACTLCFGALAFGFRFFSAKARQIDYSYDANADGKSADQAIDKYLASTERNSEISSLVPENLILVNEDHPVPADYKVDVVEVEKGYSFDRKAAPYLQQMLSDMRKEGLRPMICSTYRSEAEQTLLFKNKVNRLMREGYPYQKAFEEAKRVVNLPGRSEHNIGYAADIVSTGYTELDDGFAQTDEAIWLEENCQHYGFILRYPKDKQKETGIIYEPWHFRYVGKSAATEIMNEGICLEEYLDQKFK